MTHMYRLAADFVVIVHMAYVLTVVLGLPAIWIGLLLRHQWPRSFWLRVGHLVMILIVVAESWAGMTCPLTVWEREMRSLAGQRAGEGAFLANLAHDLLFYEAEPWVFTMLYTGFGALVVGTFLLAPPAWHWQKTEAE